MAGLRAILLGLGGTQRIYEDEGLDAVWPFVLALIERANDRALASIGAGILEDILRRDGARAIDRIEARAAIDPPFRFCLSHVWRGKMPSAIWAGWSLREGTSRSAVSLHTSWSTTYEHANSHS